MNKGEFLQSMGQSDLEELEERQSDDESPQAREINDIVEEVCISATQVHCGDPDATKLFWPQGDPPPNLTIELSRNPSTGAVNLRPGRKGGLLSDQMLIAMSDPWVGDSIESIWSGTPYSTAQQGNT